MPRTKRSHSDSLHDHSKDTITEEDDVEDENIYQEGRSESDDSNKRQMTKVRSGEVSRERSKSAVPSGSKPHVSFATMIRNAIANSRDKRLLLNELYDSIAESYPYFRNAGEGWKNSIRHNLSINPMFIKVPKEIVESGEASSNEVLEKAEKEIVMKPKKGCYWMVRDLTEIEDRKRIWVLPEQRRKSLGPRSSRSLFEYRSDGDDPNVIHILPFTPIPTYMDIGRRYSDSFLHTPPASIMMRPTPSYMHDLRRQNVATQTYKMNNGKVKSIYCYPGSLDDPSVEMPPLPIEEVAVETVDMKEMPWGYVSSSPILPHSIENPRKLMPVLEEMNDEAEKQRPSTLGPQILPRRPIKDVWLSETTPGFDI